MLPGNNSGFLLFSVPVSSILSFETAALQCRKLLVVFFLTLLLLFCISHQKVTLKTVKSKLSSLIYSTNNPNI